MKRKKVLLHDRRRHTARGIASPRKSECGRQGEWAGKVGRGKEGIPVRPVAQGGGREGKGGERGHLRLAVGRGRGRGRAGRYPSQACSREREGVERKEGVPGPVQGYPPSSR